MSDVAALIADMVRAGVDPDLIGRAAAVLAANAAAPKTARQERNARYYRNKTSEKRLNSDDQDVSDGGALSPKKEIPPTPPKEKTTPIQSSEARASSLNARATKSDFETWYRHYPHKVQRGAAERAFVKALSLAGLEDLIAGVDRYVAAKPADRQWQNPATWLNGKGWLDAPAAAAPQNRATAPPANRKPNAFDAYEAICRERGWNPDEPDFVPSPDSDAQCLSAERREHPGAVVDLRQGADWHRGSSDH